MLYIIIEMSKHWVERIITAKMDPRTLTIKVLVDHLENLENQDLSNENFIKKEKDRKRNSFSKSINDSNITHNSSNSYEF